MADLQRLHSAVRSDAAQDTAGGRPAAFKHFLYTSLTFLIVRSDDVASRPPLPPPENPPPESGQDFTPTWSGLPWDPYCGREDDRIGPCYAAEEPQPDTAHAQPDAKAEKAQEDDDGQEGYWEYYGEEAAEEEEMDDDPIVEPWPADTPPDAVPDALPERPAEPPELAWHRNDLAQRAQLWHDKRNWTMDSTGRWKFTMPNSEE